MSMDSKISQFHLEIEKQIGRKRTDQVKVFSSICYFLMKDLNQQYSEILEMPVPLVMELIKIKQKEIKEIEKQSKRRGR